jgi:ATP-dependent DNA ligase
VLSPLAVVGGFQLPPQLQAVQWTVSRQTLLALTGLSRFEELSRRGAARTAILYASDLIEHDGEDLRRRPLLDRKGAR